MGDSTGGDGALRALLAQASQGDELAFDEFYQRSAHWMLLRARLMVGEARAEEFMARLYLAAWADVASYDPRAATPLDWLWALAAGLAEGRRA